jgi:hypothetical protein
MERDPKSIAVILGKMKGGGGDKAPPEHEDRHVEAMQGFIDAVHAKDAHSACEWWDHLCADDDDDEPDGDEG